MKTNHKKFWKQICPDRDTSSISLQSNNTHILDNECPAIFNTFFSSVFTSEVHSNFPEVPDLDYHYMTPTEITEGGIMRLINNLKVFASAGIHGFNSKILKNIVSVSSKFLVHIFQQSLTTGILPFDWKIAKLKLIIIFKPANKISAENYRPISLTCICCKMLEHIIASNVFSHLEHNNFFYANQHEFRKSHTRETQLFELTTDLHFNMNHNLQTDCTFHDFAKAFDCVAYCRTISKS